MDPQQDSAYGYTPAGTHVVATFPGNSTLLLNYADPENTYTIALSYFVAGKTRFGTILEHA